MLFCINGYGQRKQRKQWPEHYRRLRISNGFMPREMWKLKFLNVMILLTKSCACNEKKFLSKIVLHLEKSMCFSKDQNQNEWVFLHYHNQPFVSQSKHINGHKWILFMISLCLRWSLETNGPIKKCGKNGTRANNELLTKFSTNIPKFRKPFLFN